MRKICHSREKYDKYTDKCIPCPKYQKADQKKKPAIECVSPICKGDQVVDENGECIHCGACSMKVAWNKCSWKTCTTRQILLTDGRCKTCPDYQIPDPAKMKDKCGA